MLVAALLLATPAIDYTCTATPVPAVLAALTAQSGVEMRSTSGFENKLLVLSVKGVEPQALRDRIADDYLPKRLRLFVQVLLVLLPDAILGNSRTTAETVGVAASVLPVMRPVSSLGMDRNRTGHG